MAAGIGETSAILSIAQIGITLAKTLITYIEEVRGAPSHIRRIGNEILTTSERLKDIGELVDQNSQTKTFSEEGINSAVRCSTECQQIIKEVKTVLYKGGWQDYPTLSDRDEVDTSLFSTLRWPFAKIKLEVPRAELHRIKLDLSLLLSAARVLGASTAVEKQRLAQDIPKLHKARAWATKRAEEVKEMAQYRTRNSRARDMVWSDDDPQMLEEFVTFKERLFREEEEKIIRERARIIQAEDDARRRKEEEAQREVERKAVEEYQNNQREQEIRSAEKRDNFRKELERLGLESAQIQAVMDNTNLDFQAASGTVSVPEVRPSPSRETAGEQETTPSATSGWSRLNIPWWRPKKPTRENSPEPSVRSMLLESNSGPHPKLEFETWLLDFCTHRSAELLPSADWLIAKMKTIKKDQDVWSRFARLRPYWRSRIFAFLEMQRQENPGWTLYHLEVSQRWPRTRLFGQRHDDQSMMLILCRRRANDQESDMLRGGPKIEAPGGNLPKRVTFAEGLREEAGTERELNAVPSDALARSTSSLKERIAILEEKRNGLGAHDHERIADLNDMIDYLQDQRQLDPMESQSNRAPTFLREEISSRQGNNIIEEGRYDSRPSSPPHSTTPLRRNDTDEFSVASHYPRDNFEIVERDSSPGRTIYEDRYGHRNSSRGGRERRRREEEDIVGRYHANNRSSQRQWQGRSRSRSRPFRQDSLDLREGPVFSRRRDRSWERTRSQPSQPSRQLSKKTDNFDPHSHDPGYYKPDYYDQGISGQSQALVLRPSTPDLRYDFVPERVVNSGVRVRGDGAIESQLPRPVVLQHIRGHSRPPTLRRSSYRDQSWAPSLRRRLSETWHKYDSSEDEESKYPSNKRIDSEIDSRETELSDAEVLAQTLKRLTNITESDIPISASPIRTNAEVGPSALKNASYASPGPDRKKSKSVPRRKAHFSQPDGHSPPDGEGQNEATIERSKPVEEEPSLDKIFEEPDVMTNDNDIPHHQRVIYSTETPYSPRQQTRPSSLNPLDLTHDPRETSPQPQSRKLDSPRTSPANGPIILERDGYTQEQVLDHPVQETGYDEVEKIRHLSERPTSDEEVD